MDISEYINPIFTLIGIVVAALLATSGYLLRWKHEYRKSARRALYLLLQIRSAAIDSIFSPADATEAYIDHLISYFKDKGVQASRADVTEDIKGIISGHFQNLIDAIRQDIESSTLEQYEKALYELSAQNPVLAYQLQGKEKFQKLLDVTRAYNESVFDKIEVPISEELTTSLESTITSFEPEVQKEVIDILDEDILKLSKYCGRQDYRRCKQQLMSKPFKAKEYDFSELDEFFTKFFAALAQAISQKKSA
ncbi:hypothetical protein VSVS12_04093 [Vibrio scophthalmi]|uniref:hypothetical protein n=1 Tax=Vibrio scophthalmi TaxID=45658 RepID=UPI0008096D88|nr:hypothetical protein [Vibrio scophthalmi]ANS87793.1 hypothetical protein VSVS12_04093 [Vibrio scophthalmi]